MADVTRMLIQLEARLTEYERSMAKARQVTNQTAQTIERRFDRASNNLNKRLRAQIDTRPLDRGAIQAEQIIARMSGRVQRQLAGAFDTRALAAGFREVAAAAGVAFGTRAVIGMTDAYTRLQNQLRVTGLEGQGLLAVQDRLFETANRNGIGVEALARLYGRASLAAKELGVDQGELLGFTSAISDALRIQGGSAESASGALLQLSQALGAGTVRAEEFNSIIEGALPIAQAAARGIERFGGSVAKLRAAVVAGEVTSKEFFEGIMKDAPNLAKQAAQANLTLGQSFTTLGNQLMRFVGAGDQASGASAALASAIQALGNNLDTILPALITVAAAFGGKWVAGLTAAAAAKARLTAAVASGNAVMIEGAQASAMRAQAALVAARADEQAALALVAKARAGAGFVMVGRDNALVDLQRAAVAKQTAAAEAAAAVATARRVGAEAALATAMRATTLAGRTLAASQRALAFVGGPVGLAFTALTAGLLFFSGGADEAQERTERLQGEMEALGIAARKAAPDLDDAGAALDKMAGDEIRGKLREIREELGRLRGSNPWSGFETGEDNLLGLLNRLELLSRNSWFGEGVNATASEIRTMVEGLRDGSLAGEEVLTRLDEISKIPVSDEIDQMISSLRTVIQLTLDLGTYAERVQTRVSGIALSFDDVARAVGEFLSPEKLRPVLQSMVELEALTDAFASGGAAAYRKLEQEQRNLAEAHRLAAVAAKAYGEDAKDAAKVAYDAEFKRVRVLQALEQKVKEQEDRERSKPKRTADDRAAEARAEALADIEREIQLNRALIGAFGQGEAALERIRAQYEALNDVRRLGLEGADAERYLARAGELVGLQQQMELLREGAELTGSIRSEEEKRAETLARLNELRAAGAISEQTYRTVLERTSEEYQRQQRLVEGIQEAGERAFERVGGAITDAFARGEIAALDFGAIAKAVIADLLQSLLEMAVLNPLKDALGSALGSALGGLSGGVSSSTISGIMGSTVPSVIYHGGGVAGRGGLKRSVPSGTFAGAPRYHSGGIAGLKPGEVPAILQAGEIVLPRALAAAMSSARAAPAAVAQPGPAVQVQIINQAPDTQVRQEQGRGPGGEQQLRIMIERVVADGMQRQGSPISRTLGQLGVKPPLTRR